LFSCSDSLRPAPAEQDAVLIIGYWPIAGGCGRRIVRSPDLFADIEEYPLIVGIGDLMTNNV
jgi:hypothetical protein